MLLSLFHYTFWTWSVNTKVHGSQIITLFGKHHHIFHLHLSSAGPRNNSDKKMLLLPFLEKGFLLSPHRIDSCVFISY